MSNVVRRGPKPDSYERGSVYVLYGEDDEVLYVGMTAVGPNRTLQHAGRSWFREVRRAEFKHFATAYIARRVEGLLIEELNPKYNKIRPAQVCSNCGAAKGISRGRCPPCYAYYRTHGKERPDELIVAHATRFRLKHEHQLYRWQTGEPPPEPAPLSSRESPDVYAKGVLQK